ncbi:MAG: PD40 domain-containing protein, partial [Calditrichia bacterium]|nr:PD40 domain-containing protein [Calditrichia bacterium]
MRKLKLLFLILVLCGSLNAQWFYFGRNKVQYYDFKWKILQTKHFEIYYYPEMEEIAEIGAKYAEESYEFLETKFEYTVHKRIPLIFYATHQHFQQTNITPGFIPEGVGGFFEFLKGRVVIPANGDLNQFKKVIQHELVHVFMFFKVYYENKEHKRLQPTFPPLWFTEGLAEFWSGEWNSQAEMIIKDAVLHNYIVPLKYIYAIRGTFMMYKEGEAICRFIKERYGEEKVFQLMDNIWKFDTFEEVFIEILGIDYATFDKEWSYYLKKKYYPQIEKSDLSYFIDPTIVKKGFNFKPAFYKNGKDSSVVFYTNRTGYSEIVSAPIKHLDFKQEEKLTQLIQGGRNSKFEAFHLFSSGIDVNKNGMLVFSTKSSHSDKLYIYDIEKKKLETEKRWKGLIAIQSPSISDDGSRVVFNGISFGGQSDLYFWDRNSDELIQLTNDIFLDDQPDISPDGEWAAFVSDRTEYGQNRARDLYIINISSGELIKLTSNHHKTSSPKWFPDGNKIAYISDHDLQYNIRAVQLPANWQNHSFVLQDVKYFKFTDFLNGIWDLTITDGGKIIYSVFENRSFQFRIMRPAFEAAQLISHSQTYMKKTTGEKEKMWYPLLATQTMDVKKLKYSSKYQLDFAQTQVAQDPFWGTRGGGYISFSDLLSNQYFNVMVYKDPQLYGNFLSSLSFAASYINLKKRINYAASTYRLAGRFYNHKDGYFYEDRVGGSLAFSYPLSHFSR